MKGIRDFGKKESNYGSVKLLKNHNLLLRKDLFDEASFHLDFI